MRKLTTILLFFAFTSTTQAQYSLNDRSQNYTTGEKIQPVIELAAAGATTIMPQENGYALHYLVSYTATRGISELLFRTTDMPRWGCSVIAGIAVMSAGMAKETHIDDTPNAMDVAYNGIGTGAAILTFNFRF